MKESTKNKPLVDRAPKHSDGAKLSPKKDAGVSPKASPVHNTSAGEMPDPAAEKKGPGEKEVRSVFR